MHILIVENNLFWSIRLQKSIKALEHSSQVITGVVSPFPTADVAIINLGLPESELESILKNLKEQGTYLIGHAGHKEKSLIQYGTDSGCDQVVSNGTLTYKLADVLKKIDS